MPSHSDMDGFRNLPRHIVSLCANLVNSALDDVASGHRPPDSLRLLINGDEWLDFILKDTIFDSCPSYYILLDEQIRRNVHHLRANGFELSVFFVNTGLDWVHKHFKCDEFVPERDYRDTSLGQALCTKILPILGINQMYHTLLDLGIPVHGGRFRRNRELVESLQYNVRNHIFLTSVKDDIWLRSGVSVVHLEDAIPPNGVCRIWSSVVLQSLLNLNRTQFIEMLCVYAVVSNPSFHKGCLNIPSQGAMAFLSDVSLHNIVQFSDWLSYQEFGFRFSSPIFEINEAMVACRAYYSMKAGPNIAEIMDRLVVAEKADFRGGRDDIYLREAGREPSGKWHFPVPGYGYVLPMYADLFPKLEHKLKEHAIRSKGNGRAIPVIALRYLRRNTDDCTASIEQENMSSLEDGLRISHRSYAKIRQDVIDDVWCGDPEQLEAPLIPMCPPELPTPYTPITQADILAFNRFQIVCEALWLQCPHAFVLSAANTPAFYANDGLYRSQLLRIRKVDRFNKSNEKVIHVDADGSLLLQQFPSSTASFQPVNWEISRFSELDDESNADDAMSVSTISPRGSPRGIERSSLRAGPSGEDDWVSIAHSRGQNILSTKSGFENGSSTHSDSVKSSSPRANDFKTFEAISSMQSQGIAFETSPSHKKQSAPGDSKFFPSFSPEKNTSASIEFPMRSPNKDTAIFDSSLDSPGSSSFGISPLVNRVDTFAPYSDLLSSDISMSLLLPGSQNQGSNIFSQLPSMTDISRRSEFVPAADLQKSNSAPSLYTSLSADGPTLLDTLSALGVKPPATLAPPGVGVGVATNPSSRAPPAPPGFSDLSADSAYYRQSSRVEEVKKPSGKNVPALQFSSISKPVATLPSSFPPRDVSIKDSFLEYEDAIIGHVSKNRISIISGGPGCGKSWGIPSMLLANAAKSQSFFSMAMSEQDPFVALSIRTGLEKSMGSGSIEMLTRDTACKCVSHGGPGVDGKVWVSSIAFMVRYIAQKPEVLKQYTHILVDDVNDRSVDNDLMCLLLKTLVDTYPTLKVIFVSTTPNIELLTGYFSISKDSVLNIESKAHPVDIFYTDNMFGLLGVKYDKLINKIHTGYCNRAHEMQMIETPRSIDIDFACGNMSSRSARSNSGASVPGGGIHMSDHVSGRSARSNSGASVTANVMHMSSMAVGAVSTFQYVEGKDLLKTSPGPFSMHSPRSSSSSNNSVTISDATIRDQLELALVLTLHLGRAGQTILIFVAGLIDMYELSEKFDIKRKIEPETGAFRVCLFHSEMSDISRITALSEEIPTGMVKVVIVGDLGEASVSVPNVNHVICLGSCKMLTMNESYRAFQQVNYFISQATASLRAGKTGRSCAGGVYRLYAKDFYSCLPLHTTGDIVRLPIPKVLMKISFMLEGCSVGIASEGVARMLSRLPEPPAESSVDTGIDILLRGSVMGPDMKLTRFGFFSCELGKDLSLCNMLYDGITLGIGPIAVVVAAALSLRRSPFKCASSAIYVNPDDYYEVVRLTVCTKAKLDGGYLCEPLMLLSLLVRWRRCKSDDQRSAMCLKYGLSFSRVEEFDKLVKQLAAVVSTITGNNMDLPVDMSPYITPRIADMVRLISVWSFPENICKMEPIVNPPSRNLNCAVIQAQTDITHSLFDKILLGPTAVSRPSTDAPVIQWKLVERGKKVYSAIALERSFKETLAGFKSVFLNMNVQVGWIECKHLEPEEVVIIAQEELNEHVGKILTSVFPTVDSIGVHEGVALFVVVAPSAAGMRRMVDVCFDSYSSICFVTSEAGAKKQRRVYYHATLSCTNCQPTAAHIRHVFLRSTPFCRPCLSLHSRECSAASPCDIHWKLSSPDLLDKFSNWFFKTKIINASTHLVFAEDPPSPFAGSIPPRAFTIEDIPIGLRILNSIRSGSQKNQVLHLVDNTKKGEAAAGDLAKVDVKMKTAEPHWYSYRHDAIQTACGVGILANSSGTPKKVVMPLQSLQQVALHTGPEELYCVCGNLSILADNTARAAGVTFLPLGQKWLNLALFSLKPVLLEKYAAKYGVSQSECSKAQALRSLISIGPRPENVLSVQALVDELFQQWY